MANEIKGAPLATTAKVPADTKAKPVTVTLLLQADGQTVGILPADFRTFASGKQGYGHYGKAMLPNGQRLQLSCNLVVIEPKAK